MDELIESRSLKPGDDHYRAYVGPPAQYDFMGATQFRLLTALGLREEHHVLDIGCGSLRSGRMLIAYLLPDRYCGVEPNAWLIEEVIATELGAQFIELKAPKFEHNAEFDFSGFGRQFDFIVAQSIFSHSGRDMTVQALKNMRDVMHRSSFAVVTFVQAGQGGEKNTAEGWVYPGLVTYDHSTIMQMLGEAGLKGQALPWFHPRQVWYLLSTDGQKLLTQSELAVLGGAVLRDSRFAGPKGAGKVSG